MNAEAVTAEVMEEFTDALAPEWAGEAVVCWEASKNVADDAGVDAEAVFRDEYADRFIPTDERSMEWCLRKRAKHTKAAEDIRKEMDWQLEVLASAFRKRIAAEDHEAAFWTDMAARGIRAQEPDKNGKRTMRTNVATIYVSTRKHIEWPDDDATVEIGRALGVEPRVKVSPDKTAIKSALEFAECDGELLVINKATGEPIDALTATYEESVTIK